MHLIHYTFINYQFICDTHECCVFGPLLLRLHMVVSVFAREAAVFSCLTIVMRLTGGDNINMKGFFHLNLSD